MMTTPDETPANRPQLAQGGWGQTPSQTVGPFYGYALPYPGDSELVPPRSPASIRLHGTVYDGAGSVIPDALLEIWQPDSSGHPVHAVGSLHRDGFTFTGFGRAAVDADGHYSFSTVKPGPPPSGAPFVVLTVFARGLLHHLFTRVYFPDEALTATDPFLASIEPTRRHTLMAVADGNPQVPSYRFDVRLQGEGETVFLQFPLAGAGPA